MPTKNFYFQQYEDRKAPEPLPHSPFVERIWQVLAVASLLAGGWYITWRWLYSLNFNALWFALPMATAESCAYFGLILFVLNLWKTADYPLRDPPETISDCLAEPLAQDRPVKVDVFITTYNEDEELVRFSIRDAIGIRRPNGLELKVYVLDDGRRPLMKQVALEEGAHYISRDNNLGFKAGNLRNAMEKTDGDFIMICDADTRPFPTVMERTLGYFRDPDVAIVQTPQWFYDLPEGVTLSDWLGRRAGRWAFHVGSALESVFGEIRIGEDPFVNDPAFFYDIIQRRRNPLNASFCCGAGSLHRREAVMFVALKAYSDAIGRMSGDKCSMLERLTGRTKDPDQLALLRWQAAQAMELTPYKFHVSEDIYSTIVLHQNQARRWKTVLHPNIESRMLSPQDLLTWTIQRFKYAGGSLDIFFNDNPVTAKGMTLGQRLMYLNTFWSYLGAIWNFAFLSAPIIYLFSGTPPVSAYTGDFFAHALPFLVLLELSFMAGTWGLSGYKAKVAYLASFPISLRAIWAVIRKQTIKFPVTPKERQKGSYVGLVWPQLTMIVLTVLGLLYASVSIYQGQGNYSLGGLIANGLWGINNILAMAVMVRAAFWKPDYEEESA